MGFLHARAREGREMTEAELETAVRALLKLHGLWGYHTHDSRRSEPGWPDWCIIGRRVIYRELKSQGGKLSSEQTRVRNLLLAAGQDWAVWRPADLHSGRIQRELAAVSASSSAWA
jgi:hypothetical protein